MYAPHVLALLDRVIETEGGLVDDPKDRGGITKYGISLKAYPALGADGIRKLTKENARSIYFKDYYTAGYCSYLPIALAYVHMDACVNCGVGAGIRFLQRAIGVAPDGAIGPKTLAALERTVSTIGAVATVIADYTHYRMEYHTKAPTWRTHGGGWSTRITRELAHSMRILYGNK